MQLNKLQNLPISVRQAVLLMHQKAQEWLMQLQWLITVANDNIVMSKEDVAAGQTDSQMRFLKGRWALRRVRSVKALPLIYLTFPHSNEAEVLI